MKMHTPRLCNNSVTLSLVSKAPAPSHSPLILVVQISNQGSLFVILPPPGRQLKISFFHPQQLKIRLFHYHQLKIRFFNFHQLKIRFFYFHQECSQGSKFDILSQSPKIVLNRFHFGLFNNKLAKNYTILSSSTKNSLTYKSGTTKNQNGQKLDQQKIRFSGQIETPASNPS